MSRCPSNRKKQKAKSRKHPSDLELDLQKLSLDPVADFWKEREEWRGKGDPEVEKEWLDLEKEWAEYTEIQEEMKELREEKAYLTAKAKELARKRKERDEEAKRKLAALEKREKEQLELIEKETQEGLELAKKVEILQKTKAEMLERRDKLRREEEENRVYWEKMEECRKLACSQIRHFKDTKEFMEFVKGVIETRDKVYKEWVERQEKIENLRRQKMKLDEDHKLMVLKRTNELRQLEQETSMYRAQADEMVPHMIPKSNIRALDQIKWCLKTELPSSV